ncbi:MAG TPA: glycosyltransferase 87 family protein, partial [Acidimicrobiales bacterium]|nr:glycosyltransferase 87 family protein [Acidimicrobiales bacterium]
MPGLRGLILGGVVIRLALAPFTSWTLDDGVWYRAASSGAYHIGLYSRPGFSYPPVWGHVLQALGLLLAHVGLPASAMTRHSASLSALSANGIVDASITSPAFNLAFKSILFAFDLGTALIVRRIAADLGSGDRKTRIAFATVFLNPLLIWESAVMGAFDVVVAFSIVAAVYFVLQRSELLAGAALVVGVLTKVTPAVTLPAIVVAAAIRVANDDHDDRSRSVGAVARSLGLMAAGGACAGLVLLGPELAHGGLRSMIDDVFARGGGAGAVSGLSIENLTVLRPLSSLHQTLVQDIGTLRRVGELVVAAAITWSVVVVVRRRRDGAALLDACVIAVTALLLVAPISQPQYIVWLIPLLVASRAVGGGHRWEIYGLSAASIAFLTSFLGPFAFFTPLALFTGLLG